MYIHSWHDFQDAAEALYRNSPNKTRYCVKLNAGEGKLVLKITDNVSCIKFKTNSSIFLNRFEALNFSLMQKMQNVKPPPSTTEATPTPTPATAPAQQQQVQDEMQVDSGRATPLSAAPVSTGGVKKKKPKKKK